MATGPLPRSTARFVAALAAVAALALTAGCTSGSEGAGPTGSGTDGATDSAVVSTGEGEAATTTTAPPVLLGLAPNLALGQGQCYSRLPPEPEVAETTTSTTVAGETTVSVEPTVPPTLPETTTTTPRPANVALVDCAGSHDGAVYATFCLGPRPELENDLTAMACPGDAGLEYPGDRTIRRAATRVCLQRFEEAFGEAYGLSTRVAEEFVPTEALWTIGDRRVVCVASAPSE